MFFCSLFGIELGIWNWFPIPYSTLTFFFKLIYANAFFKAILMQIYQKYADISERTATAVSIGVSSSVPYSDLNIE
jgi:hypothetical protein